MNLRRLQQVIQYGWKDAGEISKRENANNNKLTIFFDILFCYFRYNVWSNQYKKEKLYSIKGEERKTLCQKYQEKNAKRDRWVKDFFDNYKFLYKWSAFKYERSASLQAKRRAAYKKQYGLRYECFIGYDVLFHKHHYVDSNIVIGEKCGISEHVDIDYTGGLELKDRVWISEGTKIFTHNHEIDFSKKDENKGCIQTPLLIQDGVWIGARTVIMPGVKEIGRGAYISSCSFVRCKVPPYAIVMGNPAKIVGFRSLPKEIVEMENGRYSESERIPLEILEHNYNKYYKMRLKDIKDYLRQ